MSFLAWLQSLGMDANPAQEGFQAQFLYVVVSILLPVSIGTVVGFGLRAIERVFGIELGRGGH